MRQMLFGNPHSDFLNFRFESVTPIAAGIVCHAELEVGWFHGDLPMPIGAEHLTQFLAELDGLRHNHRDQAELLALSDSGSVQMRLNRGENGHVKCKVDASLQGSALNCEFESDLSALEPLHDWWKAVLDRCETTRIT